MLDPNLLRTDPDAAARALAPRGYEFDVTAWRELDARRKELQVQVQELQSQKNQSAKSIGQAKARGEDIQPLLDEVKNLGTQLGQSEAEFIKVRDRQQAWLMEMPNLALPEVPVGADENENVEIRKWGEPPDFDFDPQGHVELGEGSGMIDFPSAAKRPLNSRFDCTKISSLLGAPIGSWQSSLENFLQQIRE
jgi:seryl-tRNA synthetase